MATGPGLGRGAHRGAVHGAFASVPGEQLPVQDLGERRPLPPGLIRLL